MGKMSTWPSYCCCHCSFCGCKQPTTTHWDYFKSKTLRWWLLSTLWTWNVALAIISLSLSVTYICERRCFRCCPKWPVELRMWCLVCYIRIHDATYVQIICNPHLWLLTYLDPRFIQHSYDFQFFFCMRFMVPWVSSPEPCRHWRRPCSSLPPLPWLCTYTTISPRQSFSVATSTKMTSFAATDGLGTQETHTKNNS